MNNRLLVIAAALAVAFSPIPSATRAASGLALVIGRAAAGTEPDRRVHERRAARAHGGELSRRRRPRVALGGDGALGTRDEGREGQSAQDRR